MFVFWNKREGKIYCLGFFAHFTLEGVVFLGTHAEGMDLGLLMGCLQESRKELYPCNILFESTWKELVL